MSAKNVKTLRAAHESWNKRDFAGVIRNSAANLTYTDHARPLTLNTREKFREWTEGWAKAFSDGRISNPQYIDAGDIVVAQFTAEGTNDGPFGSMKPTGRKMSLPFCEICHFDKQGRIVSGGVLLRPIHTLDSTRSHPTACRGSITRQLLTHTKGALPARLFPLSGRRQLRALGASSPAPGHPPRDPSVGAVAKHLWYLAAR